MNANEANLVIDELYELVQAARPLPLSADKCIIEREHVLDLLDEIIAALPESIKKAQTIVSSRNELINQARKEAETSIATAQSQANSTITSASSEAERLKANAKAEAESIIKNAKEKAQEMVSKEAIYKEAEKQSKDMIENANNQISELKAVSFKYMSDSLKKTAETIEASLKDVNDTRTKFDSMVKEKDVQTPVLSSTRARSFIDVGID